MTRDADYTHFVFLKPGVVSHNAMLQAISFFSLTLFFVLSWFLVRVKKAMVRIYNIHKSVVSSGDRGRSFPGS